VDGNVECDLVKEERMPRHARHMEENRYARKSLAEKLQAKKKK